MIDEALEQLAGALAGDGPTAGAAMQAVWQAASTGGPDVAGRALDGVAPLFDGLPAARGSRLAVLAGALVEQGAEPGAAVAPVVDGWLAAADLAYSFAARWTQDVRLDPPEPTDDPQVFEAVVRRLAAAVEVEAGTPEHAEVRRAASAWFTLGQWTMALTTFLQRREARRTLPRRDELADLIEALQESRYDLDYLVDLLRVLDDERLVVVDRVSGRGFEVVVGGIGDNFQLHTLLADALVRPDTDGWLIGPRPRPAEVAAATDGPLRPPGGMHGFYDLVDGEGHWIWNEGVPADIPVVAAGRVVVLEPLARPREWEAGRQFEQMVPSLRVERVLPIEESVAVLTAVPVISTPQPR